MKTMMRIIMGSLILFHLSGGAVWAQSSGSGGKKMSLTEKVDLLLKKYEQLNEDKKELESRLSEAQQTIADYKSRLEGQQNE